MEESVFAIFLLCDFRYGRKVANAEMEEKIEFDVSKVCRACLTEKEEMRSVFMADESIGQQMHLAEMIMGFTNVQVEDLFLSTTNGNTNVKLNNFCFAIYIYVHLF